MRVHGVGLSPGSPRPRSEDKIRQIVDFWNGLRVVEQLGATSWDVLEPLERRVTEALAEIPPDLEEADRATMLAFAHISCASEF